MNIRKRFRFEVGDELQKIEADAWKNARALGFRTLAQIDREMKKGPPKARKLTREWDRYAAVARVCISLCMIQHFDQKVKDMLAGAVLYNKRARAAIARLAAKAA
jgi:hypothetical protein